ncbi:phage holin family protein [Marivirga sp.]|uniref:phage holin family protein n=1 Tax=Marivirga sp. TaxID=2018662 RepID=UPI0025CDCAA9|nr:phage holin family protein [Marivirga sp.]
MKSSKLLGLLGLDKIIESLQKLLEVRIAMIRKEIEEKIAEKLAKLLPLIMVGASLTLLILFGSLTLAFYLTEIMESYVYGFGIVALGYLLLTVIFILLKDSKFMKKVFSDSINKSTKEE